MTDPHSTMTRYMSHCHSLPFHSIAQVSAQALWATCACLLLTMVRRDTSPIYILSSKVCELPAPGRRCKLWGTSPSSKQTESRVPRQCGSSAPHNIYIRAAHPGPGLWLKIVLGWAPDGAAAQGLGRLRALGGHLQNGARALQLLPHV